MSKDGCNAVVEDRPTSEPWTWNRALRNGYSPHSAQPQLFQYEVRVRCRGGWNIFVILPHLHCLPSCTGETVIHHGCIASTITADAHVVAPFNHRRCDPSRLGPASAWFCLLWARTRPSLWSMPRPQSAASTAYRNAGAGRARTAVQRACRTAQ